MAEDPETLFWSMISLERPRGGISVRYVGRGVVLGGLIGGTL